MPINRLFSLHGQAALVTGGGAGIGKAISLMFAEAGAMDAVTDLKQPDAEAVAAECRKFGIKAIGLKLDVTYVAERVAMVGQVVKEFGKLTVLVNNAGGGGPKPFNMPMADFEWAFQLNVYSLFRLSQLAHPHMKTAGGGAIVNISSMAGENKNKRMCSYGASKAAVNQLTRNMGTWRSTSAQTTFGSTPSPPGPFAPPRSPPCSPPTSRRRCSSTPRSGGSARAPTSLQRPCTSSHRRRRG